MSRLCRIFGHRSSGYNGHGPAYGVAVYYTTDGLNTDHYKLKVRCDRCAEHYVAGMFHADGIKNKAAEEERQRIIRSLRAPEAKR
jgi:hypothetical protein